eukprot:1869072-Prymnesium_polylepis.1
MERRPSSTGRGPRFFFHTAPHFAKLLQVFTLAKLLQVLVLEAASQQNDFAEIRMSSSSPRVPARASKVPTLTPAACSAAARVPACVLARVCAICMWLSLALCRRSQTHSPYLTARYFAASASCDSAAGTLCPLPRSTFAMSAATRASSGVMS